MKELNGIKILEVEKLNAMNEADLKKELTSCEKSYFTLKMKKELGEVKQTHLMKLLRRYIARIKTIANNKGIKLS